MIRFSVVLMLLATLLTSCSLYGTESPTKLPDEAPTGPPTSPSTSTPNPNLPTPKALPIDDGGLLTGQPCASPCFFGIRIGETPLNQVVSELEKNGISPCTQDADSVSCGFSVFIGVYSPTPVIDSIGYLPSVPISVQDVIEKYGDPDLIQVFPGDIPEYSHISILLFWDSIHMRIHLPEIDGETYVIEKNTYIELVTFFDETQYADLRKNAFSRPWQGYGTYQLDPSQ